jgi:hypothetical protein
MPKKEEKGPCGCHCGCKCMWVALVLGVLLIAAGLNMFESMPYVNGWTIIGLLITVMTACKIMK